METVAASMAQAAARFLDALDDGSRERAHAPFDDELRRTWFYWPGDRQGLPLRDMRERQRTAAHELLATGTSAAGLATVERIMALEAILGDLEREAGIAGRVRDPELYHVVIYGEPDGDAWGWRFEGHHVSLHYTLVDGRVACAPSFVGANPARVPSGPRAGLRVLAPLEDAARDLLRSLDPRQRERALVDPEAPPDILTRNLPRVDLDEPRGVPASAMTASQRARLIALVRSHAAHLRDPLPEAALRAVDAAAADVHFAWAGGAEPGEPHYYRIQAEALLIEYDNVQNDANHIHAVWRDARDDFGEDMLRAHRRARHG